MKKRSLFIILGLNASSTISYQLSIHIYRSFYECLMKWRKIRRYLLILFILTFWFINVRCKKYFMLGHLTPSFTAYSPHRYSREPCLLFYEWKQVLIYHVQPLIRTYKSIYKYLMEKKLEIFDFIIILPLYLQLRAP